MKTILALSIFIIANFTAVHSQWQEVYSGISQDVNDVKFINANTGWILLKGTTGSVSVKILKTTNKGTSWSQVFSGDNNGSGGAIEFIDNNTGFLYYNNKILRTTNGFQNYTEVASFPISTYYRIKFANSLTGYALLSKEYSSTNHGISVYKTVDGGNSWFVSALNNDLSGPGIQYVRLDDITFSNLNQNEVYICGYVQATSGNLGALAIRSTDGFTTTGYSGVQIQDNPPKANFLANIPSSQGDIRMLAGNNVFALSNGSFLKIANTTSSDYKGISFSDNTRGFYATATSILFSSDGGSNWSVENSTASVSPSRMVSFGEAAMIGGYSGKFYRRRFPVNLKANFDWQGTNNVVQFTLDNLDGNGSQYFNTPQFDIPLLGGTSKCTTNTYIVNGTDTTARFYYWGGIGDGRMNAAGSEIYFTEKGDFNADFKTKLKSTTENALKYSNQVKALKDTNGVTNLVYESMGGIFYTRTKSDGTFKAEEVLSSSAYNHLQGYATFNNKNPFLSEVKNANNSETNMWACWERREGNNIKIITAARLYDVNIPPNWPKHSWGSNELLTLNNVPSGFECFPKIFLFNSSGAFKVITYLKPEGNLKKLVARLYFNDNFISEYELIAVSDIQEYAIASIPNVYGWEQFFNLNIAYRVGQSISYKRIEIGKNLGYNSYFSNTMANETNISLDNSRWRASLDISLKNTANSTNAYNMQPVITYQGRYDVRVMIDNEDGPPIEQAGAYYPIYVKERLSAGNWSSSNISYNSPINTVQMTPNIEGSKHMNSCILDYARGSAAPFTHYKVVPRWNGALNSGFGCNPTTYTGTDAKFVKGGLINNSSTSHKLMTLSLPENNVYTVGTQNFTITNGSEGDGSFDAISGSVESNDVQYTFNLGNILVNSNNIGFLNDIDTTIEDSGELNENMVSETFSLNENDTLIIGRNAAYVLNNINSAPIEIEYWVRLMNKTKNSEHRLLVHDTLRAADSVLYEYLEGYIIRNIEGGTDSFYVQLEIDTVDGNFGIGGGLGGDGDGGGDAPNTIKKKIFWENENLTVKSNTLPTEFALYQNFPNPFNPATVIKYDLPKDVKVTVKIYDLLGREVVALVNNEFKNAGRYELNWNAGKYASGVYIYRIEAGDYISTKKMILVK